MAEEIYKQSHWVVDAEKNKIHISNALSGTHGYYCPGCNAAMIAHKGDKNKHHFIHNPKEIEKHRNCIYSDETFRHKIAKEILQRIKQIKVGELFGVFNEGNIRNEFLIKDSRVIKAHSVKIELYIYENALGQINVSQDFDTNDATKYFLIKPDVVFFDDQSKPILLIEIRSTNKVDDEKLAKLYKLGIDTVEVRIPEYFNMEEIENVFSTTDYTKWLYSHGQSIEFNPSIHSVRKRSRRVDVNEEEVYSIESSTCRQYRIGEAIRRIKKFMGSSEFETASERVVSAKARLHGEIILVEQSTKSIESSMGDVVKRARKELESRGRKPIHVSKRDFADLERRYFSKRSKIIKEQIRFNTINIKYKRRIDHFKEIARDQIRRVKQRVKDIEQEVGFIQIDSTYYDQQERDLGDRMAQLEEEENRVGRERKIIENYSRKAESRNSDRSDEDIQQLIERITLETARLQNIEFAFIKTANNQ